MAEGGEEMDWFADLLSKPFLRRTFQEKLDIIKNGRTTPKQASLSQPGTNIFSPKSNKNVWQKYDHRTGSTFSISFDGDCVPIKMIFHSENTAVTLTALLASLNSCSNPWIYMIFSGHLLQDFLQDFLHCLPCCQRTTLLTKAKATNRSPTGRSGNCKELDNYPKSPAPAERTRSLATVSEGMRLWGKTRWVNWAKPNNRKEAQNPQANVGQCSHTNETPPTSRSRYGV